MSYLGAARWVALFLFWAEMVENGRFLRSIWHQTGQKWAGIGDSWLVGFGGAVGWVIRALLDRLKPPNVLIVQRFG